MQLHLELHFSLLLACACMCWSHNHVNWDPDPLPPQFWLPSRLIERFKLGADRKDPCDIAEEAIELGSDFGRLNNYLIELVHMLEIALFTQPPKVLLLSPLYDRLTKWHLDVINATSSFACVKRWDDEKAKKYPLLMKLIAEDVYFQEQKPFSTFRGEVLAQIFLRPSQSVRDEVEAFEKEHKLTAEGYNALHFRSLEDSCLSRIKWMFDKTHYPYSTALKRHINEQDICLMSDDYVRWKLEQAGTSHLPLVISHDGQNPKRLAELVKTFNAIPTSGEHQKNIIVDILLLIRANTFIPNVASSLSQNVEHVRRVLHLEDTFEDDWRIMNVPGTLPYHPSDFAKNGTRRHNTRRHLRAAAA